MVYLFLNTAMVYLMAPSIPRPQSIVIPIINIISSACAILFNFKRGHFQTPVVTMRFWLFGINLQLSQICNSYTSHYNEMMNYFEP